MGGRALVTAPEQDRTTSRGTDGSRAASPAVRLLDALRAGDDAGVLAVCGDDTVVTADNMGWACRGRDEIHRWLVEVHERFPGLTFESRTRHLGFGLVIDEARVRDVATETESETESETEDGLEAETEDGAADRPGRAMPTAEAEPVAEPEPAPEVGNRLPVLASRDHPMWDDPVTAGTAVQVWQEEVDDSQPPIPLNMPLRVTVRHDDLQVHEVSLSFPAALFKRALGRRVDPLEMSLSEVQSAFIAPVGAGFTTYALDRPVLTLVPMPVDEPDAGPADPPPPLPRRHRRRHLMLVPPLVLLALAGAGSVWWAVQGGSASQASTPTSTPTSSVSTGTSSGASAAPSAGTSAGTPAEGAGPVVVQAGDHPSRRPNVTLRSDLAFGFDSATLSAQARSAVAAVAAQVRRSGLTGTIYVDGYTDDIGSAAYGRVLSQHRADAVAGFLRERLGRRGIRVVAVGHGEADPVAGNATEAGRRANRRVTITLPRA